MYYSGGYSSNPFEMMMEELFEVLEDTFYLSESAIISFLFIMLAFLGIYLAVAVVFYVLESLGLYTVAKRRNLGAAGVAWIPGIGAMRTMAKIGDKAVYAKEQKDPKLRVWLLVLYVVTMVVSFASGCFSGFFGVLAEGEEEVLVMTAMMSLIFSVICAIIGIAIMILQYVSYYRFYRSCRPGSAVIFLVLGIFFSFLFPIFTFVCRKHDAPELQSEPTYYEDNQQSVQY
ncbi:MAG: hypothetical protein IJN42_07030 [Clostridia bacterium]|nr:hypothetical protein [Clostridia bacterium]